MKGRLLGQRPFLSGKVATGQNMPESIEFITVQTTKAFEGITIDAMLQIFIDENKTIAISGLFEYTICNRVARSLFGIGDQAETCAQLFYVKE